MPEEDDYPKYVYNSGVDAVASDACQAGDYRPIESPHFHALGHSPWAAYSIASRAYTYAAYSDHAQMETAYDDAYTMGDPYGAQICQGLVQEHPALLPARPQDLRAIPVPPRPLNVIHVGPFFLKGGAEQWLLDFIANVDRRYLRVIRCISTIPEMIDADYVSSLSSLNVTLECGGVESVREAARDADVLLSWGIDLDHFLGDFKAPLSVQIVHGDGPMNRRFLQRSRQSIDHAVAVSHRVNRLTHDLVPSTTIYNGVDATRLAPTQSRAATRKSLGFRDGDFVIGFCGRLAQEKRPHTIVDAVSRLPSHAKVLLVGWGRLLPELREMCEQLLPDRHVITYGDGDIGDLYRAMDVFCLTSDQEGFSLAMLEAMLCQLPIVSTPVGCAPELLTDRVTGLLTDGSSEHLAATLRLMEQNRQWTLGLAAQGHALAERFAYASRMARDYEYLLHHLWHEKAR